MNFTPLKDMILVRPDPEPQKIGSMFVPQGAVAAGHKPGESRDTFLGTVVAVGPGDTLLTGKCLACGLEKRVLRDRYVGKGTHSIRGFGRCSCGSQQFAVTGQSHLPMELKIGDRVAYPRRPTAPGGNCDIEIEGEKFVMFHEEQFGLAVVEA